MTAILKSPIPPRLICIDEPELGLHLNDLFLRIEKRRYNKKSDGTPLFAAMQFAPVYDSCRYFRAFYDDLTAMGRG